MMFPTTFPLNWVIDITQGVPGDELLYFPSGLELIDFHSSKVWQNKTHHGAHPFAIDMDPVHRFFPLRRPLDHSGIIFEQEATREQSPPISRWTTTAAHPWKCLLSLRLEQESRSDLNPACARVWRPLHVVVWIQARDNRQLPQSSQRSHG